MEQTIPPFDATYAKGFATDAIDRNDFSEYQIGIIHAWLQTITALAFVLVPLFFVLDIFITPREYLVRFAIFRAVSTLLALFQHLLVRNTRPARYSYLHGYFVSLQVGGVIALMTVYLGGFTSGYYAGLIMVIIGVNLLMPWKATHTAANSLLIIAMYVGFNLVSPNPVHPIEAANNLFFLIGTSVISVAINHVRYQLIQTEFSLLVQLKQARDALWGEMELAKQVQVALLPRRLEITGYEIAVSFEPAREVGGDYYDVIETESGDRYVAIGDVAGHGLDSGLIMMMAQTSVMTVVKGRAGCTPAQVLETTNAVLRENVGRLGSNHYMTMTVMKLENDQLCISGHHQDILIYRDAEKRVETVEIAGSWLGIADSLEGFVETVTVPLGPDDCILLFSDGVTEATSLGGELFGQERLAALLLKWAPSGMATAAGEIVREVNEFQGSQQDDMTLILVKHK